jgi:P27 family predicted phage terminase small subunit
MGLRGPAPKPSELRKLEGLRAHRPLPENEPQYPSRLPRKPKKISAAASKIWDELVAEMGGVAILRSVDRRALWQLCEDEAILAEAYDGLWKLSAMLRKKAEAEGKTLPAGPVAALLTMTNGRVAMAAIRDLAARTIVERREFGLTPASRTRVTSDSRQNAQDPLDDAIFNRDVELLVLPKPN